ncbi:sodium/hydrogen exchanger 10 [Folsomia candida]|nr:sodium/hydrogen exchanger 10 [Folsomia candida]
MRSALSELKEDGLIDEKEYDILLHLIESKMKGLWHTPSYMTPRRPEMVVADLQWVSGSTDLLSYLLKQATILQFAVGDVIYSAGDDANGIYIIVSGVVKINYKPSYDQIQAREDDGIIPNADIFHDATFESEMTDYFTTGAVLGELGVLTGFSRASTATCETGVMVYHLSQTTMQSAMESFDDHYDSLEGRLWRTFGMKLGAAVLPSEPAFQAWTMDKIKAHLELSAVPIGDQYLTVSFPSFISDVVLIYGQVVNVTNPTEIYTAPCLIPSTCLQIRPVAKWQVRPRVMIISSDDLDNEATGDDEENVSPSTTDIRNFMMTATKPASIDEDQVSQMNRPSAAVSFGVHRNSTVSPGRMSRRLSRAPEIPSNQGSNRSRRRRQSRAARGDNP